MIRVHAFFMMPITNSNATAPTTAVISEPIILLTLKPRRPNKNPPEHCADYTDDHIADDSKATSLHQVACYPTGNQADEQNCHKIHNTHIRLSSNDKFLIPQHRDVAV